MGYLVTVGLLFTFYLASGGSFLLPDDVIPNGGSYPLPDDVIPNDGSYPVPDDVIANGGSYRLPEDVIPYHYDVRLLYDIDPHNNYSFYGVVNISLIVVKPTSKIVLHAQEFSMSEDKIILMGASDSPSVTRVSLNTNFDLLTLDLEKTLQINQIYNLTIPFYGNLIMGLTGVYISSYAENNSKAKEYLIATQFEPILARKGFPCFDEPIYKATFRMVIGHHKYYTAVSNMPLEKAVNENALESYWPNDVVVMTFKKDMSAFVWDHFETSVPMSTYLVAFVVAKFSFMKSPPGLSNTDFKIWARSEAIYPDSRDNIVQATYASIVGPKLLSHFEKWFNLPFPLPKLDMIAIPDFASGAMENWGLITLKETKLMYDKLQSSSVNKVEVAETIAHELSHQWFGNLVTMKWWSDLWLNEGFATYAGAVGVNAVEPYWKADLNFAVDSFLSVLSLDALESSHPVSAIIDDPKRIAEMFDEISYYKGCTLIRMLVSFLGEEVFKEAIHNYLVKYSYKNAEQDDLWQELTETSLKHNAFPRTMTVKQVMDTWTTQTGYPLLTVERDYLSKSMTVMQKRFVALGAKAISTAAWWVPLRVLCQKDDRGFPAPLMWLADDKGVTEEQAYHHAAGKDEWVLFNPDMIALYRVNYDKRNWELLTATLKKEHNSVPVLGRVQLLSDAFELAWTNHLNYTTALQLAGYLQHEQEYLPLETGLKALAKIEQVLKRRPEYGVFQKYVRNLVGETYEKVGGLATKTILNEDDLNSVKMQILTSSWACRMKVPGCEDNAMELFQSWMDSRHPDEINPIPIDLRRTVYCVGISRGSVRHWRFVLERKQNAKVAAARRELQSALTCTREVWLLYQYLEWAITDGSGVRRQDSSAVIQDVLNSDVGYYVAKDFFYNRIQDIYNAFTSQRRYLGAIIENLLYQFTTQRELDEFLVWYEMNAQYLEDSKLKVEQSIEHVRINIAWINKNKKIVVEKLSEFSSGDQESGSRRFLPVRLSSDSTHLIPNLPSFIWMNYMTLTKLLFYRQ